jgi:hypothetical protein
MGQPWRTDMRGQSGQDIWDWTTGRVQPRQVLWRKQSAQDGQDMTARTDNATVFENICFLEHFRFSRNICKHENFQTLSKIIAKVIIFVIRNFAKYSL